MYNVGLYTIRTTLLEMARQRTSWPNIHAYL